MVDDVPEPVEVGENVVHHTWVGPEKLTHSGPKLGWNGRTSRDMVLLLLEVMATGDLEIYSK